MRLAAFGITADELVEAAPRVYKIIAATPAGQHALAAATGEVLNELLEGLEPGNPDDFETLARRACAVLWAAGSQATAQAALLTTTALGSVTTAQSGRL